MRIHAISGLGSDDTAAVFALVGVFVGGVLNGVVT